MTSHPDADGFLRAILANPTDPTTRLIFADWLDDTGRPGNAAWAEYIRARAAGDEPRATDAGRRVVARLTLPADGFPARAADVFDLIPPARIRLRMENFTVSAIYGQFVPEAVAREKVLMPVAGLWGPAFPQPTLLVVAAHPADEETGRQLAWVTNRAVVLVGADPDEIRPMINWAYGTAEQPSMPDTEPTDPGFPGFPEFDDSDILLHGRNPEWT